MCTIRHILVDKKHKLKQVLNCAVIDSPLSTILLKKHEILLLSTKDKIIFNNSVYHLAYIGKQL
jgi:hypothetical protein